MTIIVDDLLPGHTYTALNQGQCISPQKIQVTVHWIGPDAVHYRVAGRTKIEETTRERFLAILNGA